MKPATLLPLIGLLVAGIGHEKPETKPKPHKKLYFAQKKARRKTQKASRRVNRRSHP